MPRRGLAVSVGQHGTTGSEVFCPLNGYPCRNDLLEPSLVPAPLSLYLMFLRLHSPLRSALCQRRMTWLRRGAVGTSTAPAASAGGERGPLHHRDPVPAAAPSGRGLTVTHQRSCWQGQSRGTGPGAEVGQSLRGCWWGGWDAAALPTTPGTVTPTTPAQGQLPGARRDLPNEAQQRVPSPQYPLPRSQ